MMELEENDVTEAKESVELAGLMLWLAPRV